jgi:hypothetical protein
VRIKELAHRKKRDVLGWEKMKRDKEITLILERKKGR